MLIFALRFLILASYGPVTEKSKTTKKVFQKLKISSFEELFGIY